MVGDTGRYGEEMPRVEDVALVAGDPVRAAVLLQVDLPDGMLVRLDQELLRHPLLARVEQAALPRETFGVESGAEAAGTVQGHLKIVSSCLNIGNAVPVSRFLGWSAWSYLEQMTSPSTASTGTGSHR
jgi:hypothetical protein